MRRLHLLRWVLRRVNALTVGIVDYQAGNVASMRSAFQHLGARAVMIKDPSDADSVSHIVLPGVGSFGHCRRQLNDSGLVPFLETWTLVDKRPLLGVCVGLQLLTQSSDESPGAAGLGWIPVKTHKLTRNNSEYRVPHVGWNDVAFSPSFEYPHEGERDYYFDHSFAVTDSPPNTPIAICDYAGGFVAALRRDSLYATQFHPEKSQRSGLDFLKYFLMSS